MSQKVPASMLIVAFAYMLCHCSAVYAQGTYRVSMPISPQITYCVYVNLTKPTQSVQFGVTGESGDESIPIKSAEYNPRNEKVRSEQLHVLQDIPSFGANTTYLQIRIPKTSVQSERTLVEHVAVSPRRIYDDEQAALRELRRRVAVVVPADYRPVTKSSDSRVQLVYALDQSFCAKPLVRRIVNGRWQTVWELKWTPHKETSYAVAWNPLNQKRFRGPGEYHFAVLLSMRNSCADLNKKKRGATTTLIDTWFVIRDPKDKEK